MNTLEEVKKILQLVRITSVSPGKESKFNTDVARDICQLFELKLPENPYPQGDFRWGVFDRAIQAVKELND